MLIMTRLISALVENVATAFVMANLQGTATPDEVYKTVTDRIHTILPKLKF